MVSSDNDPKPHPILYLPAALYDEGVRIGLDMSCYTRVQPMPPIDWLCGLTVKMDGSIESWTKAPDGTITTKPGL